MTENIEPEATYLSYPHIPSEAIDILPQSETGWMSSGKQAGSSGYKSGWRAEYL